MRMIGINLRFKVLSPSISIKYFLPHINDGRLRLDWAVPANYLQIYFFEVLFLTTFCVFTKSLFGFLDSFFRVLDFMLFVEDLL